MSSAGRFWGSAAAVSIGFAALVPVLFPFGVFGLDRAADRDDVWLLVTFCTGLMLVFFGMGALGGGFRRVGVQDIAEAGGVVQALQRSRGGKTDAGDDYTRNFAVWCVATGVLLLVIYFALWMALG